MSHTSARALGVLTILWACAQTASAQSSANQVYVAARNGVFELVPGSMSTASPHAFGLAGTPEGLCIGPGNRMFVVTLAGNVYDITEGGNFSSTLPFAFNLNLSAGIACTDTEIFVADNDRGFVFEVSAGGDFSGAIPFATGLGGVVAIFADSAGRLWATSGGRIIDISAGGDFTLDPGLRPTPGSPFNSLNGMARCWRPTSPTIGSSTSPRAAM